jgi:hypothetical protein
MEPVMTLLYLVIGLIPTFVALARYIELGRLEREDQRRRSKDLEKITRTHPTEQQLRARRKADEDHFLYGPPNQRQREMEEAQEREAIARGYGP